MGSVEVFVATGGDPLAAAITELAEGHQGGWRGNARDLYGLLSAIVDDTTRRSAAWPANASALVWRIKLLRRALLRWGIEVEQQYGDNRQIRIRLTTDVAAKEARGRRMWHFTISPAELKTLVDRWQPAPASREAMDALRRAPAALAYPAAPAARRRFAAETQPFALSRERILAGFAPTLPPRRAVLEAVSVDFSRFRAAGGDRLAFPLRDILDARFVVDRGAKPIDVEAARAERDEDKRHALFDAVPAATAGDGLSDELSNVARALAELSKRVDTLQGRAAALVGQPPDDDPLLAIGWVAKAFGKDAAALTKQAKRRGLHVLVGGRVHVRLSDVTKLYPAMSGSALLASALAKCEARAMRG